MKLAGRGKNGTTQRRKSPLLVASPGVLFPGPEGWEFWSGPAAQPVCSGPADQPRKLSPGKGCVVGLPARSFFSLPLWVPLVEESPAREQTQIRLEIKGMLGANPDAAIWSFEPVRQETVPPVGEGEPTTRQLEATAVLAASFPEEWLVDEAGRFEPAGRIVPAPGSGSAGVLRRELGRWVADFYEGGKWLHSQLLLASSLDAGAAVELNATLAQLEGEGILSRLDAWRVWQDGGSWTEDFQKALEAPVRSETRAVPRPPEPVWNLPPPALTELRAERARTSSRKKWIRNALTAYLVAALLGAAFFAWPLVRLKLAQRELAGIAAEAESIRSTSVLWREAGAWLEPKRNALELLWQVSRPLIETEPPKIEGVRLTVFDLNPKRLLLQGEGKDLELVEKYLQWLKNEPALAGFVWKNPQPKLLPNGNAQFQAEGVAPGASAVEEKGGEDESADAP